MPEQMRLLLFDWAEDGHHPVYVRRFAEALGSSMEISIAAPDSMMTELVDLEAEMIPLGRPRPAIDGRLRRYTRHAARRVTDVVSGHVSLKSALIRRSSHQTTYSRRRATEWPTMTFGFDRRVPSTPWM